MPYTYEQLEEKVIYALKAEALHASIELQDDAPQELIDRDDRLLGTKLAEAGQDSLVRIWTNTTCLVVSRRLSRLAGFQEASEFMKCHGVPVAIRASGGTTVVHRPGIINVSIASIDTGNEPNPMAKAYIRLLTLLERALLNLGLETGYGGVPGSYCDGDFNLIWRGKKLAGTAGIVRKRGGRVGRLVHGSLTVWGDLENDVRMISSLEASFWKLPVYRSESHASVHEALRAVHSV